MTPDPQLVAEHARYCAVFWCKQHGDYVDPCDEHPNRACDCELGLLHSRIEQLEAVADAAKVADDVFENRIGFTDPPDGSVGSCLDASDSILLDNAMEALHSALVDLREDKP